MGKKRQKRIRQFTQTPTVAQALAAGLGAGVALLETIDAQHNPTRARFQGGGFKPTRARNRGGGFTTIQRAPVRESSND